MGAVLAGWGGDTGDGITVFRVAAVLLNAVERRLRRPRVGGLLRTIHPTGTLAPSGLAAGRGTVFLDR
jgi:hypothetical protein